MNQEIDIIDIDEIDSGLIRSFSQFISKLNDEMYDAQSCIPISSNLEYIFDKHSSILRVKGSGNEIVFKVYNNHITKVEYDSSNNSYILKNSDILNGLALDEHNATLAFSHPRTYVYCAFLNAMPISYPKNASVIQINIPSGSRFHFISRIVGGFKLNLVISKDNSFISFYNKYYIRDPRTEHATKKKGLFEALGIDKINNANFHYSFSYFVIY